MLTIFPTEQKGNESCRRRAIFEVRMTKLELLQEINGNSLKDETKNLQMGVKFQQRNFMTFVATLWCVGAEEVDRSRVTQS